MNILLELLYGIAVFLLLNFIFNCIDEAVKFYDRRDDE